MGEEQLGRGGDIPQEVARDRARLTHQAIECVKGGLALADYGLLLAHEAVVRVGGVLAARVHRVREDGRLMVHQLLVQRLGQLRHRHALPLGFVDAESGAQVLGTGEADRGDAILATVEVEEAALSHVTAAAGRGRRRSERRGEERPRERGEGGARAKEGGTSRHTISDRETRGKGERCGAARCASGGTVEERAGRS